jgi:integrase
MPSSPLLDQVRAVARLKQLSLRTEESYVQAIRRFILFHEKRHPATMGTAEIQAYLTHLAVEQRLAGSTLNVALSAILFLYRQVLRIDLPPLDTVPRAQRALRVPVVFTRTEVQTVLGQLAGVHRLMAQLLYSSRLHLMECARLRLKDLDFVYHQLTVRDGKGEKDRVTILPQLLVAPLQAQLRAARHLHAADLELGYGSDQGLWRTVALQDDNRHPRATHSSLILLCQFTGMVRHADTESTGMEIAGSDLRVLHTVGLSSQRRLRDVTNEPNTKSAAS